MAGPTSAPPFPALGEPSVPVNPVLPRGAGNSAPSPRRPADEAPGRPPSASAPRRADAPPRSAIGLLDAALPPRPPIPAKPPTAPAADAGRTAAPTRTSPQPARPPFPPHPTPTRPPAPPTPPPSAVPLAAPVTAPQPTATPSAAPPQPTVPAPRTAAPPFPGTVPHPVPPIPVAAPPARRRGRVVAAAVCLVLGVGLLGGAAAGSWLSGGSGGADARGGYTAAREMWHNTPVDTLFPPTINGSGAGPGGADRVWTRVGVAPDAGCAGALDPLLLKALQPVGCARLLRATYTDATSTAVTTVGLVFTEADADAMAALRTRFGDESLGDRDDLMPRPYAVEGTPAARFGDKQRASWTVRVLNDAPVVVYSVTGFADARTVTAPQPADRALDEGATDAPVEAGLTYDAKGIADRVERVLRKTAATGTKKPS
ncbi:hypothetical protein [Streptomyces sp. BPTC-684]|uniref:hypothetical protein n=1 Tax=Streptomyces sp. BPTC-684 TaxID=3043734 RepID=UPI0024B0FD77|nr:hypothetical protein [Streptomyces sp. BPTC-684]WHM39581.1 hypothetical protein QIY60_23915 [Streptomyces sp. BPTC-684]